MRLNQQFIGQHPAKSGYILDFLARGNSDLDVPSGSGRYIVSFPEFFITDLTFQGKETIFQTGVLLSDITVIENSINFNIQFSGNALSSVTDPVTLVKSNQLVTGAAISNIKKVEIYSGSNDQFQPDIINFNNRVNTFNINLGSSSSYSINVPAEDIQNRFNENIFYKAIPLDFLTFGDASQAVTGEMFSGFAGQPKLPFEPAITSSGDQIVNGTEVNVISRSNARDLELFKTTEPVQIFSGCRIVLESGIPNDFTCMFRIRTDEEIFISGNNVPLRTNIPDGFTVITPELARISPDQDLGEFTISTLLDGEDILEAFLISS